MIGVFFLKFFPLLILIDIYIFLVFIRKLTRNVLLRVLWFLPSFLFYEGVYKIIFRVQDYHILLSFIIISVIAAKLVFVLISFWDFPLGYFIKRKIRIFTILGLVACFIIFFVTIYGSVVGQTKFVVKEVEFASSRLPQSFDGYKVVQVSDLHIGTWSDRKGEIEKVIDIVNQQKADVIVLTGDLVNVETKELEGFEDILSRLKAPDGVFSVLGNHDYGDFREWPSEKAKQQNLIDLCAAQKEMGWEMLNNAHTYLVRQNDSIALIGTENFGYFGYPQFADINKAMQGISSDKFTLLLTHDPTFWRYYALHRGVDLTLAGHTHGNQFSIGNLSLASITYPEWSGLYVEGTQGIYVNVGIASVLLPFRFGAWPEITVMTLRKKDS
ncbi:metallophosphoesterase [Dysgonomonas sp. 520]|uniref:metallophosphoesterase n=1 Tax=Dysgonomonas sp. 520 TaxID=2302931 RepID=UPI0013D0FED8|nr:metallophosphoesterase [Dysgonomonas sp. 520]NDW09903.1 metallophosphoesterase [Dysgonomonas sp. 520]